MNVSWEDDISAENTCILVEQMYPDDVPLALAPKEVQELSEVVDKASDLHPLRLAIAPNRFCCLEEMFDLRHIGLQSMM